ncbi:TnsD family Tn7-like transposition protein [Oceanobacillus kapialis]|uniref:TnsD family Tn7-like transposition protein n=1 Tax=Oceanobacillus kapialis TaxID=481353 RepID=UPI003850161F
MYKDELLYSVIARYHIRSGNKSYKRTLMDLFGKDSIVAIVDLPGSLKELCLNIGDQYLPGQLLNENTLWPYYRPFLTKVLATKLECKMLDSTVDPVQVSAGLMAGGISFPKYLRYCSFCYVEDENKFGEPYWHRSHQLPGVFLCHIHGVNLTNSNILYKSEFSRQRFFALSEVRVQVENDKTPSFNNEIKMFLSEQSSKLLNSVIPPVGLETIREMYIALLCERGFTSKSSRIQFKDLIPNFSNCFGVSLLEELESVVDNTLTDSWFHKILRKPRSSCHPLRHLLVLYFLKQDISSYHSPEIKKGSGFGNPPFPCLNPAAEHYGKDIVEEYSITKCKETRILKGVFACHCGFVYTRKTGEGNIGDRHKRNRIIEFGEVWNQKLIELYKKGCSFTQIATELDVDIKTARKHLENIFSDKVLPQKNSIVGDVKIKKTKENYRREWDIHKKNHPQFSRTELRKEKPSTYIWLYRNDREWLFDNLPKKKQSKQSGFKRVNWEERDIKLTTIIKVEANNILNEKNPLQRVTLRKIGQGIGKLSMLENNLDKLPRSRKVLNEITESVDKFRERRVRDAAINIRKEKGNIVPWLLIRESGLGKDISENIQEIINFETQFQNFNTDINL